MKNISNNNNTINDSAISSQPIKTITINSLPSTSSSNINNRLSICFDKNNLNQNKSNIIYKSNYVSTVKIINKNNKSNSSNESINDSSFTSSTKSDYDDENIKENDKKLLCGFGK